MDTQRTIQIVVGTAKDQLNLSGMGGKGSAYLLIQALSAIGLCGGVLPEEIEQAYQQIEQEEADIQAEKAPCLTELPTKEQQAEVLEWLKKPWKGELLTDEGRTQIAEAIQFLEDYWSAVE